MCLTPEKTAENEKLADEEFTKVFYPIALIGNKSEEEIQVKEEEGKEFAEKNGFGFSFTSATWLKKRAEKEKLWGVLVDQIQAIQANFLYREIKRSTFRKHAFSKRYTRNPNATSALSDLNDMFISKGFIKNPSHSSPSPSSSPPNSSLSPSSPSQIVTPKIRKGEEEEGGDEDENLQNPQLEHPSEKENLQKEEEEKERGEEEKQKLEEEIENANDS